MKTALAVKLLVLAALAAVGAQAQTRDYHRSEAWRDSVRAARQEARKKSMVRRDEARRKPHVQAGLAVEPTYMRLDDKEGYGSDPVDFIFVGPVLAYRQHFGRAFGLQAGGKLLLTGIDCTGSPCSEGYAVVGEGKVLLGPFNRLLLLPAVEWTSGRYIHESRNEGTQAMYKTRHALSTLGVGFSAGALLLRDDALSVTAGAMLNVGSTVFALAMKLQVGYAFALSG